MLRSNFLIRLLFPLCANVLRLHQRRRRRTKRREQRHQRHQRRAERSERRVERRAERRTEQVPSGNYISVYIHVIICILTVKPR